VKPVAIVTNSLTGGGAERSMNLLASNLANFPELKILLIPINSGGRDLVEPECQIAEIGRTWKGSVWDSAKSFVRFQLALWRFKPKVLILNCELPELYASFAFWFGKSIIVEHTTKPWDGRESLGRIVRFILRIRGASWVRVSEKIPSHPSFQRQALIRNIIDPKIFQANFKLHGGNNATGRLIFIGRLSQEKRPDLFIQLARKTGINSVVIGDGVLRIALQVENKDLTSLEFLGQCNNPWENISEKDLIVVTSEFEGDGLVALEAAAIGIPVALRDTQDLRAIGFPGKNYFEDTLELSGKISGSDFSSFHLEQTQSQRILAGRNPEVVSLEWFKYILGNS
jgi:glycosyltransferase involved in cell wall biosynthesis